MAGDQRGDSGGRSPVHPGAVARFACSTHFQRLKAGFMGAAYPPGQDVRVRAHSLSLTHTHTHTHTHAESKPQDSWSRHAHPSTARQKTHIPLGSLASRHTINIFLPKCVQRNKHSFRGVLAHVWNLLLLTSTSRPNPPGAANIPGSCSDSLPGLQLHPLHLASTWRPHCSHLDSFPCGRFR